LLAADRGRLGVEPADRVLVALVLVRAPREPPQRLAAHVALRELGRELGEERLDLLGRALLGGLAVRPGLGPAEARVVRERVRRVERLGGAVALLRLGVLPLVGPRAAALVARAHLEVEVLGLLAGLRRL